MGFLSIIVFIPTLIYETYCVSCIKNKIPPLPIGGASFYFFFNILTLGLYGIYWCAKADDYLEKYYMDKSQIYRKTYAWQWYFFGSLIFVGPFIGFSALKNRAFCINQSNVLLPNKNEYIDTRKCPFCAETIKREAIICRFCNNNLENFKIEDNYIEKIESKDSVFNDKWKCSKCSSINEIYLISCKKCGKHLEQGYINPYIILSDTILKRLPDVDAPKVTDIYCNDVVDFLSDAYEDTSINNIWYKVKYKEYEGWCLRTSIKKID